MTYVSIARNDKKELFVKYTDNEIVIDGVLDESDWHLASPATNFYESFPNHGESSKNQAIIKVMNDDTFLYVGIKVMVKREDLKSNTLRRDFQAGNSDNITMIFDTFNDGNNAFVIGKQPFGNSKRHAIIQWRKWYERLGYDLGYQMVFRI